MLPYGYSYIKASFEIFDIWALNTQHWAPESGRMPRCQKLQMTA